MSAAARPIARRDALAFVGVLGAFVASACSGPRPGTPATRAPAPEPFTVDPLVDLVPAAGLRWLVELRPRALFADAAFAAAVGLLAPDDAFATFALRHGGVDPREASQLVAASTDDAWLALALLPVDPAPIEAAFARRATAIEGRAVDRGITRFWGSVGDAREQVAVFGRSAVGMEQGRFGPLGVATYFATGRLRRAKTALRSDPLEGAARRLGDAPMRAFAPGPFEGPWARGLGGLLRASTAAGVAIRPETLAGVDGRVRATLAVKVALMGAWSNDGAAAADRLSAAYRVLSEDALGRLAGMTRPIVLPKVTFDSSALELEVTLDAVELARGLHAITSGSLDEIMAF